MACLPEEIELAEGIVAKRVDSLKDVEMFLDEEELGEAA